MLGRISFWKASDFSHWGFPLDFHNHYGSCRKLANINSTGFIIKYPKVPICQFIVVLIIIETISSIFVSFRLDGYVAAFKQKLLFKFGHLIIIIIIIIVIVIVVVVIVVVVSSCSGRNSDMGEYFQYVIGGECSSACGTAFQGSFFLFIQLSI